MRTWKPSVAFPLHYRTKFRGFLGKARTIMKSWVALIVLYVVVVIGGGSLLILNRGSADRDWIAARPLPRNHRISKHDLKEPPGVDALGVSVPDKSKVEGRYIIEAVMENKPVMRSNLRSEPVIEPRWGQSIYWLRLAEQPLAEATLNADVIVDLCGQNKECFRGEVAAIRCDEKTPPACSAGVWLTDADRKKLLAQDDKSKLVMFIPTSCRKER